MRALWSSIAVKEQYELGGRVVPLINGKDQLPTKMDNTSNMHVKYVTLATIKFNHAPQTKGHVCSQIHGMQLHV